MLAASHDGRWILARRGRDVVVYGVTATALTRAGTLALAHDDDTLVFVGPPGVLARISHAHAPVPTRVELIALPAETAGRTPAETAGRTPAVPALAPVARLDLQGTLSLACTSGARLVLLGANRIDAIIIRTAGTGLAAQPLDTGGLPVELAIPLANQQLLLALPRHAQVFDLVSSRPLGRSALPLPPPPRTAGSALGHAWATTASSGEILIYRLSDGRPFQFGVGAAIQAVLSHPATPVLVLVTPKGCLRLHCLARSVSLIDAPWVPGSDVAVVPGNSEDVSLVGRAPGSDELWRVSIGKPLR